MRAALTYEGAIPLCGCHGLPMFRNGYYYPTDGGPKRIKWRCSHKHTQKNRQFIYRKRLRRVRLRIVTRQAEILKLEKQLVDLLEQGATILEARNEEEIRR